MIRAPRIGWAVPVGIALAVAMIWYMRTRSSPSSQGAQARLRAVAVSDDFLIAQYAPKGPGRR